MSGESDLLAAQEVASLKNFVDIEGRSYDSSGGCSLMDCVNERFYTYNHKHNSICIGIIRDLGSSQTNEDFSVREELPLTNHITCFIKRLILHPLSPEDCIIWGEKAALILRFGYSATNKLQLTREKILAESLYRDNPSLKIIQCKWVPAVAEKTILILNSDSFLRVYNAETGEAIGVFNFGPPECIPLMTKYSPDVDPETPVDFDFGPYVTNSKLWTVFVLKISGVVSCAMLGLVGANLKCLMDSYQPISITGDGPLSSDSNSILCSQGSPLALVIGCDSGSVRHLILLPTSKKSDDDEENECEDQFLNRQFIFHTKEKIQLVKGDRKTSCKFHFVQDPMFDGRYACVHNGGIHLITMKFLEEMYRFLKSDENELPSLSPSVSKHLMTWSFGDSFASNKSLGVCFSQSQPQKLICCLSDNKTVMYCVPHPLEVPSCTKVSENDNPFLEENRYRESGTISVLQAAKSMLPDISPYLCSDQNISAEKRLEVLESTVELKESQISGVHDATEYLLAYLDVLSLKSDEFKTKISSLLELRQSLKDATEKIVDRYNKYSEKDEMLSERMERVLLQYHRSCPVFTDQEQLWHESFIEYKAECDKMKRTMESLDVKITDIEKKDKGADTTLTASQLIQIKDEISHQHDYISKIVRYVRQINNKT